MPPALMEIQIFVDEKQAIKFACHHYAGIVFQPTMQAI